MTTDLTILLPTLLIGGFCALATGIGWAAALHDERRAHAQTKAELKAAAKQLDQAIDAWSASEAQRAIDAADRYASRQHHPSQRRLRVVK